MGKVDVESPYHEIAILDRRIPSSSCQPSDAGEMATPESAISRNLSNILRLCGSFWLCRIPRIERMSSNRYEFVSPKSSSSELALTTKATKPASVDYFEGNNAPKTDPWEGVRGFLLSEAPKEKAPGRPCKGVLAIKDRNDLATEDRDQLYQ